MSAELPTFDVSVDAEDELALRGVLAAMAHSGVQLSALQPPPEGAACRLRVSSRDGQRAVTVDAVVVQVLGGGFVARPASLASAPAAGEVEEGHTAALPARALPRPTDAAARELAQRESSVREASISKATGRGGSSAGSLGGTPAEVGPPELEAFEALGNYQVLKHLGGGGMAEVYLARSLLAQGVDKLVALKTARRGFGPATPFGAMFLDEARVSATLQHPNLVQVFDFGEAAGRPYLAMEFIAGRDLSAVLKVLRARRLPAPPSVVVGVGIALCRALEYVHEKADVDGRALNLVHRDVGPANLMLTPRAELKLMDFGVAASASSAGDTSGLMVGKLPYMPAEQLLGDDPAPGWDLYAAGVTLYQLAALQHPYRGNPLEYLPAPELRLHRGAPSAVNAAVPASLDEVLVWATQLDAAGRPSSARQLREALEAVQRETGTADLGAWLSALFGAALQQEEAEARRLVLEGRTRTAREVPALLRPLLKPVEAVRRRVVYSEAYRRIARRPWLLRGLVAGLGALLLAGAAAGLTVRADREARRAELHRADGHLIVGRLVTAGADDALDVLLEARARWPGDARVEARLERLAARLEALGESALARGNLEEAAAHLEAALRATPGRAGAQAQLRVVEEQVKAQSRAKVLQAP